MPEYVIGALIGVGGTVLGAIIGAIISYKYSLGLVKKTEYIRACVEFRLAFSWIIQWLNEKALNSPERVYGKLHQQDVSQRHEEAISKFRVHLNPKQQSEFDKTCHKFYNEKNNHRYEGYVLLDNSSPKEAERDLALANINELLEFSEY